MVRHHNIPEYIQVTSGEERILYYEDIRRSVQP